MKMVLMQAADKLAHAIRYLAYSWGIDTPRDRMQANLDARAILLRCEAAVIDEAEFEMDMNGRVLMTDEPLDVLHLIRGARASAPEGKAKDETARID